MYISPRRFWITIQKRKKSKQRTKEKNEVNDTIIAFQYKNSTAPVGVRFADGQDGRHKQDENMCMPYDQTGEHVGGLGESDPGCIFVVKYDLFGTHGLLGWTSGVTCYTYSTQRTCGELGEYDVCVSLSYSTSYMYLGFRTVLPICTLVSVCGPERNRQCTYFAQGQKIFLLQSSRVRLCLSLVSLLAFAPGQKIFLPQTRKYSCPRTERRSNQIY